MISKQETKYIADLARLELNGTELDKMREDLGKIVDYAAVLQKANIKINKQDDSFGVKLENITREDKEGEYDKDLVKTLKSQFSELEKGYLKVKKILY